MQRSLVGSEMCIRDSGRLIPAGTGLSYRRARKVREQFERDRAQMIAAEEEAMADMPVEIEAEVIAPAGEADPS